MEGNVSIYSKKKKTQSDISDMLQFWNYSLTGKNCSYINQKRVA